MTKKFPSLSQGWDVLRAAEEYGHGLFASLPCRPFETGWTVRGSLLFIDSFADNGVEIYGAECKQQHLRGIIIVECKELEHNRELIAWTGDTGEHDLENSIYMKINIVHTEESE